jgi:hypothetical protein
MASNNGYPAFYVGQRWTAALAQRMTSPEAWKTTDTSRSSTTTTTSDPDLQLAVEADALYGFMMFLYFTGPGASASITALRINIVVPSGATGVFSADGMASLATAGFKDDQHSGFTSGADNQFSAPGGATPASVLIFGTIDTSSTAGTVGLSWAQGTSNATATVLKAGSFMRLTRRE